MIRNKMNSMNSDSHFLRSKSFATIWLVLFGLMVAFRLFLTGDRDILALNAPYDEYWFIHSAARMIWGGSYNQLAFAQLPIYSMWLAMLSIFGIPARLGIDLAWLMASGYTAFALSRLTGARWVGVSFFIYCAFNPLFVALFDRALAETFMCVLVVLLFGSGVEVWSTRESPTSCRSYIATFLFAIAFGLGFHVRKEGGLLLVPLLLLGIFSLLQRRVWWRRPLHASLAWRFMVCPLLVMLAIGCMLIVGNYLRWGLAVRYELAAPGYERAMSALNHIDAGRGPLHVTVTAKGRQLAYENSPTFKELEPFFEGEPGKHLAAHTAKFTKSTGEIGNGWFYWALRDAGAVAGWHSSARAAEEKYTAIANELESAFSLGKLKSRGTIFPSFVDPDYEKWIGLVPASLLDVLKLVLNSRPESVQEMTENASPKQLAEYIRVTGRRNPIRTFNMRGWIIAPENSVIAMSQAEMDPDGWTVIRGKIRPDVPGALPINLKYYGIDLPDKINVQAPDGKNGVVLISNLRAGHMVKTTGDLNLTLGVDELYSDERLNRIDRLLSNIGGSSTRLNWMSGLGHLYGWINVAFAIFLGMAAIVSIVGSRRSELNAIFALAGLLIGSRVLLFSILDASSWNGQQARYMAPIVPVYAAVGIMAIWILFNTIRKKYLHLPK